MWIFSAVSWLVVGAPRELFREKWTEGCIAFVGN
jgi:hypothetical protein